MVTRDKKRRNIEQHDDDEVFEREIGKNLIKLFQESPSELWSYYPGIADKIEKHLHHKKSSRGKDSPFYSYLTEREREFRFNSLRSVMEKYQNKSEVSKEDVIKALEDAAALREYAEEFKNSLLAIVQKMLVIPLNAAQKETIYINKGKSEHHSYSLIRGLKLSLTWDGKLIKIEMDPAEFEKRRKALSFVGCGSDTQSDVAQRHDTYFGDTLHVR